ncbi:MAG: HAMP domain-containing histidine kinase [Acidobacteria bacterium]|nr:HAMP domain-containing histidine kinase [Acidobacteriota bacterium]
MARVLFETHRPSTALGAGPSTALRAGPSTAPGAGPSNALRGDSSAPRQADAPPSFWVSGTTSPKAGASTVVKTPPSTPATRTDKGAPQLRIALGVQRQDVIARVAPASAAWQLLAMHRAGSIDAAIAAARSRNLTISFGILLLFGASIALLIVSTERARRFAQRQIEFVAAVSHELRTPLAVIRSAGENLADGVVSDAAQVETYGRLIEQQGRSLSDMVEQVLAFAGAESGPRPDTRQTVGLAELLGGVIETSRQLAGPSFTFDRTIEPSLPPILGQPDALRRAFQNLIDNAVKYSNGTKWVGVAACVRGRDVVVSISDRGIGIEPSDQRHIFEPFYRGRRATAAQIHGSGLGLSLVQRIVHGHGGRVEVASSPGEGSTFRVSLPIAPAEPESCPGSSSSKTNPASS